MLCEKVEDTGVRERVVNEAVVCVYLERERERERGGGREEEEEEGEGKRM